jgi:hypothetical protein
MRTKTVEVVRVDAMIDFLLECKEDFMDIIRNKGVLFPCFTYPINYVIIFTMQKAKLI